MTTGSEQCSCDKHDFQGVTPLLPSTWKHTLPLALILSHTYKCARTHECNSVLINSCLIMNTHNTLHNPMHYSRASLFAPTPPPTPPYLPLSPQECFVWCTSVSPQVSVANRAPCVAPKLRGETLIKNRPVWGTDGAVRSSGQDSEKEETFQGWLLVSESQWPRLPGMFLFLILDHEHYWSLVHLFCYTQSYRFLMIWTCKTSVYQGTMSGFCPIYHDLKLSTQQVESKERSWKSTFEGLDEMCTIKDCICCLRITGMYR